MDRRRSRSTPKVSSEENGDYLQFLVDDYVKYEISGEVPWQKKTYTITSSGSHSLKWRYIKDSGGIDGDDRAWVDFVQWTDPSPVQDPNNWSTITYKYDPSGRRIEKDVDGYETRYVYDGGNVIAEYDGNNNLTRKYIHGPGIDQPICMIEGESGQSGPAPISHWKLDEGAESTASDSAGSNDGTITGATWTTGLFGGALDFDGNGDYVNFGDVLDNLVNTGFTFHVWLNISSNTSSPGRGIISKSNGASSGGGFLLHQGGTATVQNSIFLYLLDGTAPSPTFNTTATIPLNEWVCVTATWDGTTASGSMKIYFNGVNQSGTESNYGTTPIANNLNLKIGPRDGSTLVVNGSIDDVRVFDEALSGQEVQQVYNNQNGEVYFYHYDGLGSVVALSDSYGNSCQSYQYSAYGQVAASDPNFTANPYMFTGRRFDYETGLYYYRARYYNPYIGRFLQTDPVGYSAGMNLYTYCMNNPLNFVDPSGLFKDSNDSNNPSKKEAIKQSESGDAGLLTFKIAGSDTLRYTTLDSFEDFENWMNVMLDNGFQVTFFEFVGHGVEGAGILMGKDTFGIMDDNPEENWYGINDWGCLFSAIFAPNALIEFEACYSANYFAKAIKELMPDADVYGYTGLSQYVIPCLPIVWETQEHVFDPSSEWIQIGGVVPRGGTSAPIN